jgi:hypothetical protein
MQQMPKPFSAFRGRPLSPQKGQFVSKLAEIGVFDIEQFVGLGTVDSVTPLLSQYLGMSPSELLDTLARARIDLPDSVNAKLAFAIEPGFYTTGAMLEPTAKTTSLTKSLFKRQLIPAKLPTSMNHIALMFPVQDQGPRGTCVAFGATALHEFYARHPSKPTIPRKFSEQFLYEEIKRIDGSSDCGTWLVYAIQVIHNRGQCAQNIWAYNPNAPCNNNGTEPPLARTIARGWRANGQMIAQNDVNILKAALLDQSVVAVCIPVFDSWFLSPTSRNTGQITLPLPSERPTSGHCLCAVGYQDDATYPGGGYFVVRNSWGMTWAAQSPYGAGYGVIPYQYLTLYATEAAKMKQKGGGPVSIINKRGSKKSGGNAKSGKQ